MNKRKRLEAIGEAYLRVSEVMQIEAEPDIVENDHELITTLNAAAELLQAAWKHMIDEGYEGGHDAEDNPNEMSG